MNPANVVRSGEPPRAAQQPPATSGPARTRGSFTDLTAEGWLSTSIVLAGELAVLMVACLIYTLASTARQPPPKIARAVDNASVAGPVSAVTEMPVKRAP